LNRRPTDYEENVWEISIEIIELILQNFVYRVKKPYPGIHAVYQGKYMIFGRLLLILRFVMLEGLARIYVIPDG
jgi:hypothetical protein